MNPKDLKLVMDLFLNETPVMPTTDFNMLYNLFLGQEVKPLTAQQFGTIVDLFLGYGKKPKILANYAKLMCDLFLNKKPVLTTPDFIILYDIFLGP